jgi:hypothetical protein
LVSDHAAVAALHDVKTRRTGNEANDLLSNDRLPRLRHT